MTDSEKAFYELLAKYITVREFRWACFKGKVYAYLFKLKIKIIKILIKLKGGAE